jgi:uncharacterized membrane protein YidH (DUF202 family)
MADFSLKKFLSRRELQREKLKDYRNIVVVQVLIVVFGLVLSEPIIEDSKSEISKLIISIFSFFAATYAFLLWDLLRNFTDSRPLIIIILVVLGIIVIVGIMGEFPYYQLIHINDRQTYLLFLHGFLFPVEITVISFALRDIFSVGFMTSDKLWGAASIFLMIGISFGSLYDLISIARPGAFGQIFELGFPNYSECVTFSFCILGGIDSGLAPVRLIRNISVIEAVWGGLYGMLIIGKLLGLPRAEDEK